MLERIAAKLTLQIIIVVALVVALAVQTVRIDGFKFWFISIPGAQSRIDGLTKQNAGLRAELQRITTAKDEQRKETSKNIREAEERVRVVERVVTKLENRPVNPEKCETPDLGAWRGVL